MNDVTFFFSGWEPLARIIVVGTLMYIALVIFLRLSGSRTLSSMNAFDFIVTVAIGSAFGGALTAKGVALAEAIVAFTLLIMLQYLVAWLQTRWGSIFAVLTNPPTLLYFRGHFLREAMDRQRVTESALRTAARQHKFGSMDAVEAIILESNGDLAVIAALGDGSAFGQELMKQAPVQRQDIG